MFNYETKQFFVEVKVARYMMKFWSASFEFNDYNK